MYSGVPGILWFLFCIPEFFVQGFPEFRSFLDLKVLGLVVRVPSFQNFVVPILYSGVPGMLQHFVFRGSRNVAEKSCSGVPGM